MSNSLPEKPAEHSTAAAAGPTGFSAGWLKGVMIGLFGLALAVPLARWSKAPEADRDEGQPPPALVLADFKHEPVSPEVRHVANWALYVRDNRNAAIVLVDKKNAKVFVLSPGGELMGAAPALMGSAHGDHTVPGVGDKPVAQVLPDERTTPAGRFVAESGRNAKGEDIVWVDYDAAVSLHRVRANVASELRLERLASVTPDDNRISYGCINLPVSFYESVLSPTVRSQGAIVYVLPETRTPAEVFGSYDVPLAHIAQRHE